MTLRGGAAARPILRYPPSGTARGRRGVAAMVLSITGCAGPQSSDTVAVTNALIIDGLGGAPVAGGVVLIEDGIIEQLGPADDVTIPAGAEVVDAGGGAVMPGLADMHVHLVGGWDGERADMLGYRRYLNALLYAGVTTVFDTGNVLPYVQQLRAEVNAGRLSGPRIHMVGALVDGPDPVWPPLTYSAKDIATLRPVVGQLAAAGVDALKGYVGLSIAMLDSLVRIGAEHSLAVVVDLGRGRSLPDAVATGVAALAHAPAGELADATINAMAERGTATITTLAVMESFSRRRFRDLSFLDHELIAATTPPWFLAELRSEAQREITGDRERQMATRFAAILAQAMVNVKRMHDAGVAIVAGTDAPYPGVFQGEGLHRELELLVEAGLTPIEAISAATRNAAALFDASGEWGTLAPGRVADLVVVRGNPTEDIGATRDVIAVIQRGVLLDRDALAFDPETDPGFRAGMSVGN